ncbi:EAL domain-containing protein [Halomonas sediminis]
MRFRSRLLMMLLAVVVISQVVTGGAFLRIIYQDALAEGSHNLEVGTHLLKQVLDAQGSQLRNSMTILTDDVGFKSAMATQDIATLNSVLANHGDRAGADMVIFANLEGELLASSHHVEGSSMPFPELFAQAQRDGDAVSVVIENGQPFEFVLLPVRATKLIGWVGMGLLIDAELAEEVRGLTGLEISFIHRDASGNPTYFVSSHENIQAANMPRRMQEVTQGAYLRRSALTPDNMYVTRAMTLLRNDGHHTYALLQISRDDLLSAYHDLQWQLLGIIALILLLTVALAIWSARSISRPLMMLAEAARCIGRGERLNSIPVSSQGETGILAQTLLSMQDDIALREQVLLHQSRHDLLTDLPNRSCAQEAITQLIAAGQPFTLIRLAIDDFRRINDTFGYALGDRVLLTLAQRLAALPAPARQAYRLAGDEFLLIVECDASDPNWLDSLFNALSQPIDLQESPIRPSLTAGEVNFPRHGIDPHLLLRRADIALGMARRQHRRHQTYQEGQDEQHLRQLTLIRDLQEAVSGQQLWIAYQPKVDVRSGEVIQFEALMRWQHPTLGFVPPDEFISLAERSGNIRILSRWMIDTVCVQLHEWQRQGHHVSAAINLSAADVMDIDLPERLLGTLNHYDLEPRQLGLEVTESAVMQDADLAIQSLEQLSQAGMLIAVDDFGTGYSSLAQLKRLPVHELKIDKSFMLHLNTLEDDLTIVRSTIELGHNLGLRLVAEGVKNQANAILLGQLGCDYLQGYWIARPMPAYQVIAWLNDFQPLELPFPKPLHTH